MSDPCKHVMWAKSESQMRELEQLGWRVAKQRRSPHHFWSLLMEWRGAGDPPLPERVRA